MIHGLAGSQPGLVIVAQQLVQEVQSLWADQVLVLTVDEALPPLTGMPAGKITGRSVVALTDTGGSGSENQL